MHVKVFIIGIKHDKHPNNAVNITPKSHPFYKIEIPRICFIFMPQFNQKINDRLRDFIPFQYFKKCDIFLPAFLCSACFVHISHLDLSVLRAYQSKQFARILDSEPTSQLPTLRQQQLEHSQRRSLFLRRLLVLWGS